MYIIDGKEKILETRDEWFDALDDGYLKVGPRYLMQAIIEQMQLNPTRLRIFKWELANLASSGTRGTLNRHLALLRKMGLIRTIDRFAKRGEIIIIPNLKVLKKLPAFKLVRDYAKTSKKLKAAVLKRDNYTCQYCGVNDAITPLWIGRVIPVSRGGSDTIENRIAACKVCTRMKNASLPDEWQPPKQRRELLPVANTF